MAAWEKVSEEQGRKLEHAVAPLKPKKSKPKKGRPA
jgi:hypothetical protein